MSSRNHGWSWIGQRRLCVEALESRWNPSTVHFDDGTIVIVGTQGNDTVQVVDDGEGGVRVTFEDTGRHGHHNGSGSGGSHSNGSNGSNGSDSNDGGGAGGIVTRAFHDVDRIVFLGFDGDDTFDYRLTGPMTTDRDIRVDLGDGDDTARFDLAQGVADARLRVNVNGGRGDDAVAADVGPIDEADVTFRANLGAGQDTFDIALLGDVTGDSRVRFDARGDRGADLLTFDVLADVGEDARLTLKADGGQGADEIGVAYEGLLDGVLNIQVDAGAGDDVVAATATLAADSDGEVRARVNGGRGDDDLTLEIITALDDDAVDALLDGGRGFDVCVATPNVDVRNCED